MMSVSTLAPIDTTDRTGILEVARQCAEHIRRRNPYLRMIAVSGSLTRPEHAGGHDDVDFFVVTRKGRIWEGFMACVWEGRRVSRRLGLPRKFFCFNYLVDEDHPEEIDLTRAEYVREFFRLKVFAGAEVYAALLERFRDRLTAVDQPLYERAVYEIQASLKKDREVGTQRGRLGGPSVFYRALRLPFIVFAKWMERRRRGLYPGGLIYSNSRVVRSHFRRFWVDVPPDPDGNLAAEAFSRIADDYEHRVVASSSNLHMRGIVRQKLDGFVRPGDRVLDLGTGTGTDAIWLARRGASVLAVDVAEGMVREASQRVDEAGVQDRVEVRRLAIEELRTLLPGHARKYDLVLANFGALNLAGDPERWAPVIARLLKPGGYLVANVMNRWCAWEIFAGLLRGRFRFALRRARGDTIRIGDVPLSAALYTPRSFARRLGPYFDTRSRTGLCVFAPPPALEHVGRASPGLGRGLAWLDYRLGRWPGFRGLGDHFLMVLQQRSRPVFNYRTRAAITASPVVADVNGDGSPETVVAAGRLHILYRQGGNMRLRQ